MQTLDLCWNTIITDDGIKHMTKMQILYFGIDTNITDNGIKDMIQMQNLHLGWNKI